MGRIADAVRVLFAGADKRTWGPLDDRWYAPISPSLTTGARVNTDTAMTVSTYFACVRLIAQSIARSPIEIFKRKSINSPVADRVPDHPLQRMLGRKPNPELNQHEFWEAVSMHIEMRGNHYSEIERNGFGEPLALWPLNPDSVDVERRDGVIVYTFTMDNGQRVEIPPYHMFHVRALSYDGIKGLDTLLSAGAETVGMGLAQNEYVGRFYRNNMTPAGILKIEGDVDDETEAELKRNWYAAHGGLSNAHRVAVLSSAVTWQGIGITAEQAQLIETRNLTALDVTRLFGVQPHKVGILDNASFSNIEHQGLEFKQDCVLPRSTRIESVIDSKLFMPGEEDLYFAQFNLDNLVRAETLTRIEALQKAAGGPILTRNEARQIEGRNPLEGLDDVLQAVNMQNTLDFQKSFEEEPEPVPPELEPEPEEMPEEEEEEPDEVEE